MQNLAQAPFWEVAREDPGTFSEGGAPLRNDVTDGWREQILGVNYEEVLWQGIKIIWTTESTNHTTQKILHNREVVLESHRSTQGKGTVSTPCTPPLGLPLNGRCNICHSVLFIQFAVANIQLLFRILE